MSDTRTRGRLVQLMIAGGLGLALGYTAFFGGFDPHVADIKYDWVVAKAALYSNAHLDVLDLAAEFGVELHLAVPESMSRLHPRTPGAILLALPLTVIPFDWLVGLSVGVSAACTAFILYPTFRGLEGWRLVIAALFAAASMPVVTALWLGTQSALVALMVVVGWSLARRSHGVVGGVLLGAAVTLKVFPALLIVPLWVGKKRTAAICMAGSTVGFALLGILLPGVSMQGSLEALTGAAETWLFSPPNASMYGQLQRWGVPAGVALSITGLVVAGVILHLTRNHWSRAMRDLLPWVVLGLLLIPLSWVHYDLVLLPAVIALMIDFSRRPRLLTALVPTTWLIPSILLFLVSNSPGPWFLVARIVLLATWLMAPMAWVEREWDGRWAVGELAVDSGDDSLHRIRVSGQT